MRKSRGKETCDIVDQFAQLPTVEEERLSLFDRNYT